MSDLYLYWIHHKDHRDMTKEGYIGVSCDPSRRFKEHSTTKDNTHLYNAFRKYGSSVSIKVLALGTRDYILGLENKLRPSEKIGWNKATGGSVPPNQTGFKMPYRVCIEASHRVKSFRGTPEGKFAYRKVNVGKTCTYETKVKIAKSLTKFWRTPDGVFEGIGNVLSFYNLKSKTTIYRRNRATEGKYKDWFIEEIVDCQI